MSKFLSFITNTGVVWKTALGSAASWQLAYWAGSSHPYLAPITLILCLQATLNRSIHFAIHRVFGTALGIFITVLLASFFSVSYWTIGLLLFIGAGIGKLFNMSYLVIHQIALSILLVFTLAHQSPDYGIDRLRDTLVGALIAYVLAAFIFPINYSGKVKKQFQKYTDELVTGFSTIGGWISDHCPQEEGKQLQKQNQQLLKDLHQLNTDLEKALKDLHFSPYSKKNKKQLNTISLKMLTLRQGYNHMINMVRTLTDWSNSGTMATEDYSLWSSYAFTLATYISEWMYGKEGDSRASLKLTSPPEMQKSIFHYSLYDEVIRTIHDFEPDGQVPVLIRVTPH